MVKRANIDPNVWGSNAWTFMHYVALSYPSLPTPQNKFNYKQFFWFLGQVLPCTSCSKNYKQHWKNYPIDEYLESSNKLFEWTVIIRNAIKQQ